MIKYQLTTCTGINKEFNYLEDLIKILATDKITELSDLDIVFLDSGFPIEKNGSKGWIYTAKKVSI